MAFFDDLGKKITGMTDVAKINGAISEENSKIQKYITELGKLYYSTYAEKCDPQFLPLIKAIQDSEKKIAEYNRQKQDIKGIVRCAKCSAEIPANSVFCSVCGTPVPVQAPANVPYANSGNYVVCPVCGKAVDGSLKFCTQCGSSLANVGAPAPQPMAAPMPQPMAAPVPQPVATPIPQPVAAPIPQPVAESIPQPVSSGEVAVCPNCNEPLEEDSVFCCNCGTKVG